jgi:NIPSNAP protein
MIVQRSKYTLKPGRGREGLEIIQKSWQLVDHPPAHRIYQTISGQANVIFQEIEFEDFEHREKFWAHFFSMPGLAPLMEPWHTVVETSQSNEFLTLVE